MMTKGLHCNQLLKEMLHHWYLMNKLINKIGNNQIQLHYRHLTKTEEYPNTFKMIVILHLKRVLLSFYHQEEAFTYKKNIKLLF